MQEVHKLLSERTIANTTKNATSSTIASLEERQEILPIASVSKNFMGLTTILFLYDKDNSYLLESDGTRSQIKPEELTIYDILKNRKVQLERLGVRTELQQKKLESIEKWLAFADLGETENQTIFLTEPQDSIELDERGYSISADKFIELLSHEGAFAGEQGKYSYNNMAFSLAGEIMNLMTDKETFFDEARDRILKPLGLEKSIMPYYEVPLDRRENFKGMIDFGNGDFSETASMYSGSDYKSDCTLAAGALTATMEALQKYGEELAKFYTGQESHIKISDSTRKPSEIFEAFAVDRGAEKGCYSLGMQRKNEDGAMHFSHEGALNPHFTTFDMYVQEGEPVKTEICHYKHDTPIAFISATKELLGMYRNSKGAKKDENFSEEFKEEISKLKSQSQEEKAKVAKSFTGVAKALYGLCMSDKDSRVAQELETKRAFSELSKDTNPLAKLFVKEFERVSGVNLSKNSHQQGRE